MPDGQFLSAGKEFGPDGDGLPSAEDLFSTRPSASPADLRDELRRQMGEDVPRPQRPPDHPDVHRLAQELGLA
jgi:hypothetical protein